jgi:heme-degrading monooxygenase HmoA
MQSAAGLVECQLYSSAADDEPVMLISTWVDLPKAREFMTSSEYRALLGPELESGILSAVDQSWQVDAELVMNWRAKAGPTLPTGSYAHSVHAIAKPGQRQDLVDAVKESLQAVSGAEGLIAYLVYASSDEDGPVTSISIWNSMTVQEEFMQSELGKEMVSPGVSQRMDGMIDRSWSVESGLASSWQAASN